MKLIYACIFFTSIILEVNAQCWQSVDAGYISSFAIKEDGTLWTWGSNGFGQLGDGTVINKDVPIQITANTNWAIVSGGPSHTIAIRQDGTLWAWGDNFYGQLGDGSNINKSIPAQIGADTNWQKISCGNYHNLAIKKNGTLWVWGYNAWGELGDGTNIDKNIPVQIGTDTNWQSISGGQFMHSLATKKDGTLWGWGGNLYGQIGDGTNLNKNIPVQIAGASNWQSACAGGFHSIGFKQDGTLWAWGRNEYGQLGDGTYIDKNSPTQIGMAADWQSVDVGFSHSIAMKQDGSLRAWGKNSYGALGDGTNTTWNIPIPLALAANWKSASAGTCVTGHSLAIKQDGTLWAWGHNSFGQVGDSSTIEKFVPTYIKSLNCWPTQADNISEPNSFCLLYPNPASAILNLQGSILIGKNKEYQITNSLGQLIQSGNANDYTPIDVSNLSKGIYFLKLEGKALKFIKE